MYHKKNAHLLLLLLVLTSTVYRTIGQNIFYNATTIPGSSDNAGGLRQAGTEVLHSSPGIGVIFGAGSTFEHVGQFYVAEDGIWNRNSGHINSTDYFGYAPKGLGSSIPYQGVGIKGASPSNGGRGAGKPTFNNLELNNTGVFPVVAGMYVINSLVFNAHGPAGSNIITTPNSTISNSSANAVLFASTATITGADKANYINGYASVTDVVEKFMLPIGDSSDSASPLHSLIINNAVNSTVTARYLHLLQHSATALGANIHWVSPIGNWSISAPAGTNVTVSTPRLNLGAEEADYLRLVGWNGHQWIDLSGTSTLTACVTGDCPLIGTLTAGITDLAIGSSRNPANVTNLRVWPNPTHGPLHLTLPADKVISEIQVLDQQGRFISNFPKGTLNDHLDLSPLTTGSYILEVRTTEGKTLRQHFIRQ